MKKTSTASSEGFTLSEVVISIAILVAVTALALSGYMNLLKNSNQADVQNELDNDVQTTIEWLKKDLRLSSMDEIVGYPEGADTYEAISFPKAFDVDGDGMIERDPATHKIIWTETVIYHIRPGTPDELVRTVFSSRDNTLTDRERQNQLNAVVAAGNGTDGSVHNNAVASSKVLFANLLDWEVRKNIGDTSFYSSKDNDLQDIALGYAMIKPGVNTITFKCTGKDTRSSGYKLAIDQLAGTPSYIFTEAENLRISRASRTTTEEMVSIMGNRHQLVLPATEVGDSFTIQFNNDQLTITDFTDSGRGYAEKDQTKIYTDTAANDIVVKLDGNEVSWEAGRQCGDWTPVDPSTNYAGKVVRTMLKGAHVANGNFFESNGGKCRLTFAASTSSGHLKISDVYFGESMFTNRLDLIYLDPSDPARTAQVTFDNGTATLKEILEGTTATSDWIDIPIDENKNYILSYVIADDLNYDNPKIWEDIPALNSGSNLVCSTRIAKVKSPTQPKDIAKAQNWNGLVSSGKLQSNELSYVLPALESLEVAYVDEGIYTSDIFDTKLNSPSYGEFSWNAITTNSSVAFRVRTGNNEDLSDGTWSSEFSINQSFPATPWGRYFQFQAILRSDSSHEESPILQDVTTRWLGEERLVNVTGKFSKGPDRGDYQISINGFAPRSALVIDLEIYQKTAAMNDQQRKVSSSIKVEITPRNNGL